MAEYVKVMEEYNRMCHFYGDCRDCPLCNVNCEYIMHEKPEETESIIMKWAQEHPIAIYPLVRDVLNTMAIYMGYPVNNFDDYFLNSQINEKCAQRFGIEPINKNSFQSKV